MVIINIAAGITIFAWMSLAANIGQAQPSGVPIFSICTQKHVPLSREKIPAIIYSLSDSSQILGVRGVGNLCQSSTLMGDGQSISIKRRGHSSYAYPKHQYEIDFVDERGEDLDAPLLGMPAGSDWVLHGPYTDRSYMRNALAYNLGRKMGKERGDNAFAPRSRYVEVVVDGDYKGLYLAVEKISRNPERVDIAKASFDGDGSGNGRIPYIFELTFHQPDFKTGYGTPLQYVYPGRKKLERLQQQNFAQGSAVRQRLFREAGIFEESLLQGARSSQDTGLLAQKLDLDSFADYFIMEEVYKNLDGFRSSAYFYKGADERVHMGPLWDLDVGLGNVTFIWKSHKISGWSHQKIKFYHKQVFWFDQLLANRGFARGLVARYQHLRMPGMPLNDHSIEADIGRLRAAMGDAPRRDQGRWLGTYNIIDVEFRNTKDRGETTDENIAIMAHWLHDRLQWLDVNMPALQW